MGGRNRIVVDYGDMYDLILLGVINTKSGEELSYNDMDSKYHVHFTLVKRYFTPENIKSLYDLKDIELDNKEGFVIRFKNGFRLKIKFNEYVRIHKIVTNVSNLDIWNILRENKTLDEFVEDVPDEFYCWVIKTSTDLKENFEGIEYIALKKFYDVYHIKGITDRKEFASKISDYIYKSILFNLYSKKRYDHIIWNLIRPVHATPFSNGENFELTQK